MLHVDAGSRLVSLADAARGARIPPSYRDRSALRRDINGREYRIEVSAVGTDTFRAQIARAPGGSRAMMPFYGRTPVEAVEHLSQWLSLNHARCASQV
jgi:hypothetical protein